jgi:hypothetical protein
MKGEDMINNDNLIKFLIEEFDEYPCNINCYDEYMFEEDEEWCENNCGKEGIAKECWKKLLQHKGVIK